jgi:hypothetical protein
MAEYTLSAWRQIGRPPDNRLASGLSSLIGGGIVKPADAQASAMAGTNRPASPVGGGAGGAAIGRDAADR